MSKTKQNEKKKGAAVHLFRDIGAFVKNRYPVILLIVVGFCAASVINYFDMATSQTIASYNMADFEVGQIAFETITAPRSIPADEMNPIFIEEGEKIIRRGYEITEDAYAKLQKRAESPVYLDYREFANSELYLLLLLTLWCLLFAFASFGRRISLRELMFQVFCFLVVYGVSTFGSKIAFPLDYPSYTLTLMIPVPLFVLIEAILFGQLSTIFFAFLLSFGVFEAGAYEIVPFLFTLASCLAAVRIVRKIERRLDMIFVSIVLAFINIVIIVIMGVVFNENFVRMPVILGGVAANGLLSGILALGLVTPVEYLLNTASVFRLMDLSDLNNSIMRKMCVMASGTYQHSQMVAQLAENACRDIGADSLLARVGAYYHDIGKMDQSEYFVENQTNGVNKHNDMKPSLSVSVIRSHVRKGVEKAHQLHLPRQVIDIIEEHHGNGLITYFYEEARKLDPNVNPADFSYYGNPPSSKESAVVMLADTVEAACRTLDNPTEERLDKFIQTLINAKAEHHQLDNCNLTFRDITRIKAAFVKLLVSYYHNRIEYP
ncbi:MAG: HDIG domain-containing protein, partial [Treponemataceae bacterium]|nr:HDIG domain-containing protein [Treponemataceae bacterium]